jgi:Transglycosylase SLT domain
MALAPPQVNNANAIIALAEQHGVSPRRARELAAVALAESGLDPNVRNKSSGAAGFFQLLSSGYQSKARALGGLTDPRANTLAILPDYIKYWRQHPNAAPGEAGRDVERSGEGASFYSRGLSLIPNGPGSSSGRMPGSEPGGGGSIPSPGAPAGAQPTDSRRALLLALAQTPITQAQTPFLNALVARNQSSAAPQTTPGPAASPPPAPAVAPASGGGQGGGFLAELLHEGVGGPTHSTGEHIHVALTDAKAMLAAIQEAQRLGLSVRENPYVDPVDPVHAPHSFHNRTFPGLYNGRRLGEAIDSSGPEPAMVAFQKWVRQRYGSPAG